MNDIVLALLVLLLCHTNYSFPVEEICSVNISCHQLHCMWWDSHAVTNKTTNTDGNSSLLSNKPTFNIGFGKECLTQHPVIPALILNIIFSMTSISMPRLHLCHQNL